MLSIKNRRFYKDLFRLALPIALQYLVTFSVGLCDNIMVGRLGDGSVSGVYMGNQMQLLLQIFSGGIEGAILVLSSQYWGRRDTEAIKKIASVGLRFNLAFGFLLSVICISAPRMAISAFTDDVSVIEAGASYLRICAFSYIFFSVTQALIATMRSVEKAKVGLYISLISLATNATLNYVLIFGKSGIPALGIKGAAISTLISRIVECSLILIYILFIDKRIKLKLSDIIKADKILLRDFLKYGSPIILGQLVWAANTLTNSAIMGRQNGVGVIAALSVANTLYNLAYVVMNGLSGAVGIITGKAIGSGEKEAVREYAKRAQILFVGLGLLTGTVLRLVRDPYISIYNVSPEAMKEAKQFINVISVTVIGTCYQAACLSGLVKSGGDIAFVFKNDLFFFSLIVLPAALITTALNFPPWVVFAALKCDQILKCPVAIAKINSFNWMKNLTRNEKGEKRIA